MSLLELKDYMIKVKIASMSTLCCLFKEDAETVRSLLEFWINKGKIRRCQFVACRSRCSSCPLSSSESYEWLENSQSSLIKRSPCSSREH